MQQSEHICALDKAAGRAWVEVRMLLLHLSILWSSTGCRKHRILIDNITCRWMVGEKAISGTIGKKPYLAVQSVQCDGHQPDAGAMQGSSLSMPVEGPLRAAKRQALHSSCTTHAHLISNHVRLWRAAQQLDGGLQQQEVVQRRTYCLSPCSLATILHCYRA